MATNYNKGPVSVNLGDAWRNHARVVPVGFTPLGTVTRKGLTQSLARDSAGDYWAFGTGTPEKLVKLKVQSAIAALNMQQGTKTGAGEAEGEN